MGRKLSYWEKQQRKEEKERERKANARAVEARRAQARAEKEKLANLKKQKGDSVFNLFTSLLDGLCNLTLEGNIKDICAQDAIGELDSIKAFKYPGDLKHSISKSSINEKDFVSKKFNPDPTIPKIKKRIGMKYETYKSSYGTFFGNLFGKTNKEYRIFIDKATSELNAVSEKDKKRKEELTQKDKKRKEEFISALQKYEESLDVYNKKAEANLVEVNKKRLKTFEELETEIKNFNNDRLSLTKDITKTFNDFTEDNFSSLFGMNLPIKFADLDQGFLGLYKYVPEFNSSSYDSPSKNIKYGMRVSEIPHLFIYCKEEYFPLPIDKQINSIKSGYSVQPLTKANRQRITQNLLPSAALLYAGYAFNTSTALNKVVVSVGTEAVDKKSGNDVIEWDYNLTIERDALFSLKFDKIEPSESIDLFKDDQVGEIPNGIKWFSGRKVSNPFVSTIEELNNRRSEIESRISKFFNESFKEPVSKEQKDQLELVKKLKG